jgi:hypothetical protein
MPRSFRSFSQTQDPDVVGASTNTGRNTLTPDPGGRTIAAGLTLSLTVAAVGGLTPEAVQMRAEMQRTASSTAGGGGLFSKGGSIFGGTKTPTSTRPSTSSGPPATHSEPTPYGSTTSRTSTFGRKTSFSSSSKSPKVPNRSRTNSSATLNVHQGSPEKRAHSSSTHYTDNEPLPVRVPSRQETDSQPKSADSFRQVAASAEAEPSPASDADSFTSTTPYSNMLVRPGTANQAMGYNGPMPMVQPIQPQSPTLENITYQHIQETSSKRISTLDYLRKAYEPLEDISFLLNTDNLLVTKDAYIGSIHYYSISRIYNECHTLIPENLPDARPIISS